MSSGSGGIGRRALRDDRGDFIQPSFIIIARTHRPTHEKSAPLNSASISTLRAAPRAGTAAAANPHRHRRSGHRVAKPAQEGFFASRATPGRHAVPRQRAR